MAIGVSLQKLWNAWNIRSLLILSLCIQIILAYGAPLRRHTSNSFTKFVVWSTYLLADWVAIYVFGLISNTVRTSSVIPSEVNQGILALWASFLLIHMGGPDTITAYSLEDNALWLRHLTALIIKLCIFGYIFMKSFPGNDLVAPTVLVLVMGVIKYGERTRALFLASLDNLKSSVRRREIVELPEQPMHHDNYFFERFVGMIIDIIPSYSELKESREFFLKQDASAALDVISGELNLMYEGLYTKIKAVHSTWGRFSHRMFIINLEAALVLFCLSKKEGVEAVDVRITFGLLVGTFLVDINRGRMIMYSDWAQAHSKHWDCSWVLFAMLLLPNALLGSMYMMSEVFLKRCLRLKAELWSKTMGSFNLLEYCFLKHCPRRNSNKAAECCGEFINFTIQKCGLAEKLDKMNYTKRNDFDEELWKLIFDKLSRRASVIDSEEQMRMVYESKGDLFLCERDCNELMHYVKGFEFGRVLLTWHVATEICYNIDWDVDDRNRKFSQVMSDYMMYLLIQRSKMMSPIVGIGYMRCSDTCDQLTKIIAKWQSKNLKEFCMELLKDLTKAEHTHEKEGGSKSVLLDACRLAQTLLENSKKWEVLVEVWIEFLTYTATHCRADAHAKVLNEGGELISHVWLLMAHFGIGAHWSYEED